MKYISKTKKQKGFALLFAVLVSSIVISIGATIISISIRQTLLSSTSRESQFAFYAANTGLECAFYWDNAVLPADVTGKVFHIDEEELISEIGNVSCAGGNIITGVGFGDPFANPWVVTGDNNNRTKTFKVVIQNKASGGDIIPITRATCAEVLVRKTLDDDSGVITTKIESKGYNTCDITSPRTVERGIELEYQN